MNSAIFIASPLVGAGIGYVTNWIAIKMLFRPLRPVRLLGIEIPMLQGVIPKRHKELARSIGQTVGEHLLTEDAFEKILQSDETREGIRTLVRDAVHSMQKEERSLEDFFILAIPELEKREAIYEKVSQFITTWVVENIQSEKTWESLSSYISDSFMKEHNGFADSDLYAKIKYMIQQYLLCNLQSTVVAERVFEYASECVQNWQDMDMQIGDLIPVQLLEGVQSFIMEQSPRIIQEIIAYLNSPETKELLEERIEGFFNQGWLMSFLGRFTDKEKITDQVIAQITDFITEPENQAKVVQKISSALNGLLNTQVNELARRIDAEKIVSVSEFIAKKIASSEFVDRCLDVLEDVLLRKRTLSTALEEAAVTSEPISVDTESYSGSIYQLVREILQELLHTDFVKTSIIMVVTDQLATLRQKPVKTFFTQITLNSVEKAEKGILALLDFIHHHYLGQILGVLNFQQLVEEKILSFDLEELETLVLKVMSVELRAITFFGLYLGLLMGFITPLVNMLLG